MGDIYDSIAASYQAPQTPAQPVGPQQPDIYDDIAAHYQQGKPGPAIQPPSFTQRVEDFLRPQAEDLPRQIGLTGRYLAEGLAGLADPLIGIVDPGRLQGQHPATTAVENALEYFGVPGPKTTGERLVGDVGRGMVQGAVTGGFGGAPALGYSIFGGGAGGLSGGAAREAGFGPGAQFLASLVGGIGIPGIATTLGEAARAVPRAAASYFAPFTEAGQRAVVGRTLSRFASDPNAATTAIDTAPVYVPGSQPTAGMASADPGLLSLERTLMNEPESGPLFAQQASASNKARLDALRQVSGSPADLAAAQADRTATAQADYAAAAAATPTISPKDARSLTALTDRPAFKTAWQAAETDAANMGMRPQDMNLENTTFLDLVKKQIDTAAFWKPQSAADKASIIGVQNVRQKFLDVLDNINPQYAIARGNFAAASRPIEQMEALQNLEQRSQLAAPDFLQNPVLSQAKWKGATTGQAASDLQSILTPEQMQVVNNIGADLNRAALPGTVGRAPGSNTVQNLAMSNVLHQTLGPGEAGHPLARLFSYPLSLPYKWGGVEGRIDDMLTQAALNPKLAAQLIRNAPPQFQRNIALEIQRRAQSATLGAVTSAGAQGSAAP